MGQFAIDLSRQVNRAKSRINLVVQKATYDIFRSVIIRTPVDQGRARGNWIASVGSYGRAATIDKDKNGIKTVAQMGDKVLSTLAGGIVYMVNNVAYIKYLEYGRGDGKPGSSQAPRGMVRITLVEYQNYFNKAVREAKK